MTKKQLLDNLKRLADMMALFLGRNCEIAIHDLAHLDHSLIHLAGNITGRSIGAPATKFLMNHFEQYGDAAPDVPPYSAIVQNGHPIKGALLYIRNNTKRPIFAVCINFDTVAHLGAIELLTEQIRITSPQEGSSHKGEIFAKTVADPNDSIVDKILQKLGKHPVDLNRQERIELVCMFQREGAFRLKGMVERVAEIMGISKYTVYSYRKLYPGE